MPAGGCRAAMKVLLVHDYGRPIGGAETAMLALRDGLRERGHDARLFASRAGDAGRESQADWHCFGTTSRLQTLVQTANPGAAWQLRRTLAEFRPDVVHVGVYLWQLSPLILPLLRDWPSLYHVHLHAPICPIGTKMLPDGSPCQSRAGTSCLRSGCLPLRAWLPLMMQRRMWRAWDGVFDLTVAGSEAMRRRFEAEGLGPVAVVPYGVPAIAPRPPLTGPPTVACSGRLAPEKGVDVLLRAFAEVAGRVPEARLLLTGDGPERARLVSLTSQLGLSSHVAFLGYLTRPELERRLAAAWVQAVPSRLEEPFGLVAPEAMMRGTAVVASACGGLKEIVRDGVTGMLVPPGDVHALAAAIVRLVRDRDLAERMGQAGRAVALAQFTESTYVDRFVELYSAILERREPGLKSRSAVTKSACADSAPEPRRAGLVTADRDFNPG